MTKEQWIEIVRNNEEILRNFITRYHPINLRPRKDNDVMVNITAPQAERACEVVRESIRKESFERPDVVFNIALQKEDCSAIADLISAAWFGVPESTSCWQIEGFKEAVDLMDDPVEEPWEEIAA